MSWEQLLAIRALDAAEREAIAAAPLQACPNCGEPLDSRDGTLNCPAGDFTDTG